MKRALLTILLVISAPLAQGGGPIDETRFTLREEFLRLINRDRQQFGLRPVQLDTLSSADADTYCLEHIHNGTTGHFTLDAQAPVLQRLINEAQAHCWAPDPKSGSACEVG